jgi:hypothetical protein
MIFYETAERLEAGACLAYAAFHCSSLLAFAVSMSPEDTNREPTEPVDMDGIESSMVKARTRFSDPIKFSDNKMGSH